MASHLSNQNLLIRIEYLKKSKHDLYIENKIFFNDTGYYLHYYEDEMHKYNTELEYLEEEKRKRIQQLPICRDRLSKAVARNRSRKAVETLLTKPHYSELPKSFAGSFLNRFAGERGLTRSILNHITGKDLLPTKQRTLRIYKIKLVNYQMML